MWTPTAVRTFRAALAVADKHQQLLDRLAEIAKVSPELAQTVADLQVLHASTRALAQTALAIDPIGVGKTADKDGGAK